MLFYNHLLLISAVSPGEDDNVSESSMAGAVEDPSLAVMRKDIQDPKLYDIYKNLPVIR